MHHLPFLPHSVCLKHFCMSLESNRAMPIISESIATENRQNLIWIPSAMAAGTKVDSGEVAPPQQELVLVMPAVLPKLHTLAQAMLRCRGSHVFKVIHCGQL